MKNMRNDIPAYRMPKFAKQLAMLKTFRHASLVVAVAIGLFALAVSTTFAGNPSFGIFNQCSNDTALPQTTTCTGGWINGNLQHTNSVYLEGDSVPQRFTLTGLDPNTAYTVTIGWDIINSGKHAYDYLTTFNKTITGADACTGILSAGVCAVPKTAAIPSPDYLTACNAGTQVPPQRYDGPLPPFTGTDFKFTYWGDATLTAPGPYSVTTCPTASGSVTNSLTLTITTGATGGDVLIAYGAHIASSGAWGAGNSAGNISGSSYHNRIMSCSGNVNGCGSRDNQLQADAVVPAPNLTTQVYFRSPNGDPFIAPAPTSGSISQNTKIFDRVSISGQSANGSVGGTVTGTVSYFVCGPTTIVTPCTASPGPGVTALGSSAVSVVPPATNTYNSSDYTPTADGIYCFRAVFVSSGTNYASLTSTVTTGECVAVNTPTSSYLSTFKVRSVAPGTKVTWKTVNETNVMGFNVLRSGKANGSFKQVNGELVWSKNPGQLVGNSYSFRDKTAKPGRTYYYKIEVVGPSGTLETSDAKRVIIP